MNSPSLFEIILTIAGFFTGLYIKNLQSEIEELHRRDHELTYEIASVRENFISKKDLGELLALHLEPINSKLFEIREDLKQKQDKKDE
jgi:predicted  nucleic acid-binding Zn-ribbon protein